nr:rna polymerase ii transcription factor b subunit 4 [Quercus suber]
MPSAPTKLYADDVSLLVVLLDTNPFFWSTSSLPFSKFLSHVLSFLNSILLLNQINQIVVIATGCNSCDYVYDSSLSTNPGIENGKLPALCSELLKKLEDFVTRDEQLNKQQSQSQSQSLPPTTTSSLLSGSLSMALCYTQRVFRSGPLHPHPRILCVQGSSDGPEQYVAIMNSIFSAQRSMVPIDSCYIGSNNSAFLQQASYITGGVYQKPQQLDGLFQYLSTVFATDLHSRTFLQLPKSVGVDFRASCFCHKKTIDMAIYVLYACPYFVSITRNVQPVGQYLVRPSQMLPQLPILRERLQKHNLTLLQVDVFLIIHFR